MTTPSTAIEAAVTRLQVAATTRVPCAPVRDLIDPHDTEAAYAVQRAGARRRIAAGARVVGRKIGLTSTVVQAQLGVDRPDFGVLLDEMRVDDGGVVDISRLLQPRIEAELAFVLSADLDTPAAVRVERVGDAVDHVVAALEIVDSRIAGWDISYADTVADNASAGLFVLGAETATLDALEPRAVRMKLYTDDDLVSQGRGDACLGDPLAALAWLAATALDLGDPLRAGDVVLSGALGPMVPVAAGHRVRADVTGLGSVSVRFATHVTVGTVAESPS